MTTYHVVCKAGNGQGVVEIDAKTSHLAIELAKQNGLNPICDIDNYGENIIYGEIVIPGDQYIVSGRQPAPPSSPPVHGRLTPCFRCGEVYGPGMPHRCR
jgi:hypothetical protein